MADLQNAWDADTHEEKMQATIFHRHKLTRRLLVFVFFFMMTFHVMDNDCHTKLTAQSCNTTMTQNRKCENTKSKSARLLLTTCNCKCYSCDHRITWVRLLLITRLEQICFDMRAFADYWHKMTAVSAQCHWQSIGCLKYTFSIAELVIQSAACGLKNWKGKQERRENMYTCFHVRGDWTALTHLVRSSH